MPLMHDGSLNFAGFPCSRGWGELRAHLAALPGLTETDWVTDGVTEAWLDFTYGGHQFSVHDPFGEYWFFVQDPAAPPALLREVAAHCARLLGGTADDAMLPLPKAGSDGATAGGFDPA